MDFPVVVVVVVVVVVCCCCCFFNGRDGGGRGYFLGVIVGNCVGDVWFVFFWWGRLLKQIS